MMTKFYRFASAFALAGLAVPVSAQPRSAAFETSADPSASNPFMFSGATIRLALDGRGQRRPEFAMRLAGGVQDAGFLPRIGEGIAFSAVPGGSPHLTLAGQDSRVLAKRLKMSDGATAAAVVGGVLLVGGIILVATQAGKGANAVFDDE